MKILKMLLAVLLTLAPSVGVAQNGYFTDRAVGTSQFNGFTGLVPISYGQVRVCTSADINTSTTPCPDVAAVFNLAGSALTVPGGSFGQVTTDVVGRFNFQAAPGAYWIQVAGSGSNTPQLNYAITVAPISPLGSVINGALTITNPGVFTNTQQNDYLSVLVGSIVPGVRFSAQQGGNFATEGVVGAVPCTGTVHQCNGVAGYVVGSSTTPYAIGVYGQAEMGIANGKIGGLNTVIADTGALFGTMTGVENDINVNSALSNVTGYSLQGVWSEQPTNANAFVFGSVGGSFHWQNGFVFAGGFTNNLCFGGGTCGVFVINQSGTGAGQDSQEIVWNSTSKNSVQRLLDSNGFLFHNIGYTAPKLAATGTGNGTAAPVTAIASGQVGYAWKDTSQGVDAKLWDAIVGIDANTLRFRAVNDAENSALNWLVVTRTGVASATEAFTGTVSAAAFSATNYSTTSNCSGVGTAASPSVASCGSAPAGSFSCSPTATGATCTVNTTAVTANSQIFVAEDETLGTKLGVTCNTGTNVLPASRLLAARSAGVSFTINLGTVTTNPGCFSYLIFN